MSTKTEFDYQSFDWGEYMRHRPPYRPELYELIYEHHAAHSNRWDTAYDIGSGPGIVAAELLRRFAHVTLSDPSDNHIAKAHEFLSHVPKERLAMAKHKGEDPLAAAPDSLDFVSIFEAFHWVDPDQALDNLQRYLRPGGTLAIVLYGSRFVFEDAEAAVNEAWNQGYTAWVENELKKIFRKRPFVMMQSRLDNAHFDPQVWRDVRRCYYAADQPLIDYGYETEPSRIEPGERMEQMSDRNVFAVDADAAWVEGFMDSLIPPTLTEMPSKQRFQKLLEVMGDGAGKRRVTFPAVVVLATKK